MGKHFVAAAVTAGLVLCAASSPSAAGQRHRGSLSVKNADHVRTTAAAQETLKARRRAAIAELCPDKTLSSGQRNCEWIARNAADAEPMGAEVDK
jgi:hypothetical protein